ncbi:uncharacterized protein K489DRAFT_384346 [Dissoconium aciculare CBS 342.82]|uniref:Uncharacterized protein n=1 Tax=Dissoconium aciculare CBS 342.82 TaxID=1314786 RepID=A0A6J3LW44_9PEZI|nr:uncharacterized protein K489DRAFT_384346 [Dissoconium aciculare CBS 342.82]KAF1818852.1 hypothetical protein K489DRAFT_384346 [Dissoconium aciculare CBS 342.82]
MTPYLPIELLIQIVECIEGDKRDSTLRNITLTCRLWSNLFRKCLYKALDFSEDEAVRDLDTEEDHLTTFDRFVLTIIKYPHCAEHVKSVKFPSKDMTRYNSEPSNDFILAIESLQGLSPNLRQLILAAFRETEARTKIMLLLLLCKNLECGNFIEPTHVFGYKNNFTKFFEEFIALRRMLCTPESAINIREVEVFNIVEEDPTSSAGIQDYSRCINMNDIAYLLQLPSLEKVTAHEMDNKGFAADIPQCSSKSIRSFNLVRRLNKEPYSSPIPDILSYLPQLEHFSVIYNLHCIVHFQDHHPKEGLHTTYSALCDNGKSIKHFEFILSSHDWDLGYMTAEVNHETIFDNGKETSRLRHIYEAKFSLRDMQCLESLHLDAELLFLHRHQYDGHGQHGPTNGLYSESFFVDFLPPTLKHLSFTAMFPQGDDFAMHQRQLRYLLTHESFSELQLVILGNCSLWNDLFSFKDLIISHKWDIGINTGRPGHKSTERIFLTRPSLFRPKHRDPSEPNWLREARLDSLYTQERHNAMAQVQDEPRFPRPPGKLPRVRSWVISQLEEIEARAPDQCSECKAFAAGRRLTSS